MTRAEHDTTENSAAAHPVAPPVVEGERDDEPVESRRPWSIADEVLTKVLQMQDFARVIAAAGSAGNTGDGSAIAAVAWDIVDRADRACDLLAKLSSANKEGPAPAEHPVPSDAELVKLAFNRLHSLEDDMVAIGDFCNAIIVGLALEVERENPALGAAIHRIASEIEARYETVWEVHKELFFALNPNRHRLDLIPPTHANDGDVEEAEGDA
jgi:tRNA(Ile2) C34 agmatinyltransferase TiaS